MTIPNTLLQTSISPQKKSEEELKKLREAQSAQTRARDTAKEFNKNYGKNNPAAPLVGKDYEQGLQDYTAIKDFVEADFSEAPSEITGFSPNTGEDADAQSVGEVSKRFATAEEANRQLGLVSDDVSEQVANTTKDTLQQPIDTKQLISDTKSLIEQSQGLRTPPPAAPTSDFAGGLDYGKDSENALDNEGINKIFADAPKQETTQGTAQATTQNTTTNKRPANIESAGQLFRNLYDQNQRLEGRKDFAASLDAAGYDPTSASAEDKAKFYAQGKELGLTSKQIDKYRNDQMSKMAAAKYNRDNPRAFLRQQGAQFSSRGSVNGRREEEDTVRLQGARGLRRRERS